MYAMSSDLLWLGDGYVKTASAGGPSWVLRHLALTPHALEWYADETRGEQVGSISLTGSSLLLTDGDDWPLLDDGHHGLCLELDWASRDFLPVYLPTPEDAHDAVLVRGCARTRLSRGPRHRAPLPLGANRRRGVADFRCGKRRGGHVFAFVARLP